MKQEPYIKVAEVMTRDLHTIDSMATVREAMEKMTRERVSSLVVERRDGTDEYGVIVVTDIAREVVAANLSFDPVKPVNEFIVFSTKSHGPSLYTYTVYKYINRSMKSPLYAECCITSGY